MRLPVLAVLPAVLLAALYWQSSYWQFWHCYWQCVGRRRIYAERKVASSLLCWPGRAEKEPAVCGAYTGAHYNRLAHSAICTALAKFINWQALRDVSLLQEGKHIIRFLFKFHTKNHHQAPIESAVLSGGCDSINLLPQSIRVQCTLPKSPFCKCVYGSSRPPMLRRRSFVTHSATVAKPVRLESVQ